MYPFLIKMLKTMIKHTMKKIILTISLLVFTCSAQATDIKSDIINKYNKDINNFYTNNVNSFLSNSLGKIFPTTEVSLSSGVTNEVTGSILVVKPLTNDENNILFTQMSLFFSDDSRETLNLGIGKRKLLIDDKLLIGANLFFDHEFEYYHRRTSLGIEMISSVGYLRANQYYALSGWKQEGVNGIEERALSGNDVEVGAPLPYLPWTSVNFRSFKWQGVEGALDQEGDEMSLEAKLPFGITVEGGKRSHDGITEDAQFVEVTWTCCKEEGAEKFGISDKAYNLTSVANQRFAKVKRQNLIVKQKKMDLSVIGF